MLLITTACSAQFITNNTWRDENIREDKIYFFREQFLFVVIGKVEYNFVRKGFDFNMSF